MRITAGYLKSRSVKSLKDKSIRPSSSILREAIFNILYSLDIDINNIMVLDLFSGSGILSFEFISRGATRSTLIDIDKKAYHLEKENALKLGILNNLDIRNANAEIYIKKSNLISTFDIIILDPPYNYINYYNIINILINKKNKNSIIILEASRDDFIDEQMQKHLLKVKKFGISYLLFFK